MALNAKPRLFIGSSSESLPIVEILMLGLKDVAEVVPWTEPSIFPATEFFTTSLLRAASSFDFGLFLFEPDDLVQSRDRSSSVPRDNVVFELGVFMSHLGLKRAFPMVPRGRVRILSDLAGFQPIVYEEPPSAAELKALIVQEQNLITRQAEILQLKTILAAALHEPIERIRTILQTHGPNRVGVVSPNAWNVADVVAITESHPDGGPPIFHSSFSFGHGRVLENSRCEILHERSTLRNIQWRCLI